jgi:hypothetical protein
MNTPSSYRHIFFDLDGTLTRSRITITEEMKGALRALTASGRDVIIVSGAQKSRLDEQGDRFPCVYLAQNGNHAYALPDGKDIWRDELPASEKAEIMKHVASIPRTWAVKDESDLVEDRGSQISYSLLGHHEELERKEAFDPGGAKRVELLKKYPLVSDAVEVKIGGTTTFDYFKKGRTKGHNVARYVEMSKWKKEECVYVGDALFPGGNDEAVVGVIDVKQVGGPDDTAEFTRAILE